MITPCDFDLNLLLALNFDGGRVLDQVMYAISGRATWIPLYLLIAWQVYRHWGWRTLLFFLAAAGLMVLCADQTASLCKTHLSKLRPTHYPPIEGLVHTVNGYLGGLYGTVSGHAANAFAVVMLAGLTFRNRGFWWAMAIWATAVSYSRIYLGVHYPVDVLLGTAAGLFWGWVWYRVFRWATARYLRS